MIANFANITFEDRPVLILKNAGGTPLGVLGYAINVSPYIKYNETSVLEFELPAFVDESPTPHYDDTIGMRILELQDIGQFTLVSPTETDEGYKKIKSCKAYSLEYEFSYKKITLENATYKFFDMMNPQDTILGMIMELMPSWRVGTVPDSMCYKYRTFDVPCENLYNLMKNKLQKSYGCVFDFDTMTRTVNVRDIDSDAIETGILISTDNLAKSIEITENTEELVTRLDVSGAECVNIRDVNPSGTNQIINLDYFMTEKNFNADLIEKYYAWKETCEGSAQSYYLLSVRYSLVLMQKATQQAKMTDLNGEMRSLENLQSVAITAIAQGLSGQEELDSVNAQIAQKQEEIDAKQTEIDTITAEAEDIFAELRAITDACRYEDYFTEDEYIQLDRYIKDNELSDSSFVVSTTTSYDENGSSGRALEQDEITARWESAQTLDTGAGSSVYDLKGGYLHAGDWLSVQMISSIFEIRDDSTFIATARIRQGSLGDKEVDGGCISITGTYRTSQMDAEAFELTVDADEGFMYFTVDASEYEKRSVAWELYEYGRDALNRLSHPSYSFSVKSANFFSIDEFDVFKNSARMGERLLIGVTPHGGNVGASAMTASDMPQDEIQILKPILIGVQFNYDQKDTLQLDFGDSYNTFDSTFRLVDLLNKSISMGKSLDMSKLVYSAFADTGAQTGIKQFMDSALDVSKNAVISSTGQAISWDGAGFRLRKWANDAQTAYEDEQIWMINNSIVMTSNNWATAEMAIGKFHDDELGDCWGIVAPRIVGTLLAGSNLVIESQKKDGGTAVFRMDEDGCRLYNADFSVRGENRHITLNHDIGLVIGSYPVFIEDEFGYKTLIDENANFWADTEGNVHMKGTLHGANGEFTGYLKCMSVDGSYFIVDGESMGFYKPEINDDGETEMSPMLHYRNGVMSLYGAIKAVSDDGDYFHVEGDKMGFYDKDGNPLMYVADGNLTMTGAVNATSLNIADTDEYGNVQFKVINEYMMPRIEASVAANETIARLVLDTDGLKTTVSEHDTLLGDMQTSITQNSQEILLRATSEEVDNKISVAIDGITLDADHIDLIGYTVVNGNFKIDENGRLTAKDGTFTGSLSAGNWTFDSQGAWYKLSSSVYGRIYSNGSTMYYDTAGLHAQYGADSSHNTTLYGNYLKLVPATADYGILVCNSATQGLGVIDYEDPTLVCDGADCESSGWAGSCGNIGTRYKRWDIGWCKTMRTQDNYNDSSRTVKHNIQTLPEVGALIDSLNPVSFVYNWNPETKVSYGLIVEDAMQVLPHICYYNADVPEESAINYTALIPFLLREIQSLRRRVCELEA